MKAKINLGKIAFSGKTKTNSVILTLEIKENKAKEGKFNTDLEPVGDYKSVSIVGEIWRANKADIACGGQCYDEILHLFSKNAKVQRIVELWKEWHLNDFRAGTKKQSEILNNSGINFGDYLAAGFDSYYKYQCEVLRKNNILYDRAYEFGHNWLIEPLPENIEIELKQLFEVQE